MISRLVSFEKRISKTNNPDPVVSKWFALLLELQTFVFSGLIIIKHCLLVLVMMK